MSVELDNLVPLDEAAPEARRWLDKLQGNILRAHGRDFTVCVFFSFGPDIPRVRRRLTTLAGKYVTSALEQHREAVAFNRTGIGGTTFGSLLLSSSGYQKLGFDPSRLFVEPALSDADPASSFSAGMKETATADFADPPVGEWHEPYRGDIDAMLLLADDDTFHLQRTVRRVLDRLELDCRIGAVERGRVLRNDQGQTIEHFGFVDGISQPRYLRTDFDHDAVTGRRIADRNGSAIDRWDPFEPLRRVLMRDPGVEDAEAHGSFLVFRKLEQDVPGFHAREAALAAELVQRGEDAARAAAMIVGRFRNGTPVAASSEEAPLLARDNDFQYEPDVRGRRCPHHAHIRKVNPRGDALRFENLGEDQQEFERRRRITRRGIPYGSVGSAEGAGLLFMCFQASIRQQFAFIQRRWANDVGFVMSGTGVDSLIGQGPAMPQRWPIVYGRPDRFEFSLDGFVRMRGGEYFFAPSLPFLRGLADGA